MNIKILLKNKQTESNLEIFEVCIFDWIKSHMPVTYGFCVTTLKGDEL